MNFDIEYWLAVDGWIHWSSDDESGVFNETDTTGRYDKYLLWLADGNEPQEWSGK
jgi:hypothetical protein